MPPLDIPADLPADFPTDLPIRNYHDLDDLWTGLGGALAGEYCLYSATQSSEKATRPPHAPTNTACIIQTSGSTGHPKRVMLSGSALTYSAKQTLALLGTGQWLLTLPLNYIAGFQVVVRSWLAGYRPIQLGEFTRDEFIKQAQQLETPHRYTALVPYQLIRLLDWVEEDYRTGQEGAVLLQILKKFDAILVGGQSTPQPVLDRAKNLGLNIVTTYGSTETSGGFAYDGVPMPGMVPEIRDGELWVSGPTLTHGYLLDTELTASRLKEKDGTVWYRTGDLAQLHEGKVIMSGRNDDVFISGGVKVSLRELEEIVLAVPGLHDAVIVIMPDHHWGEVPVVVVDGRLKMMRPELDHVRGIVREALGDAAQPRQLVLLDRAMPFLDNGKPDLVNIRLRVSERPRERSEDIEARTHQQEGSDG